MKIILHKVEFWVHLGVESISKSAHAMWLPTPVYERIPQFYVLLGMLFFTNGLYLGVEFDITLYYLGAGILSFLYGIGVFLTRLIRRQQQPLVSSAPTAEVSGQST